MHPEVEKLRAQVDFRKFYRYLGAEFNGAAGSRDQQDVLCIFHEESDPSLSLNLLTGDFHCKVPTCPGGKGGDFVSAWRLARSVSFGDALEEIGFWVAGSGAAAKVTREELVRRAEAAHRLLMDGRKPVTRVARATLLEQRGWNSDTLRRFGIGLDGDRFTIPVKDRDGEIVNLRLYSLTDKRKMLNTPGHGQMRLFGVQELVRKEREQDEVLLCEGESDAITAVQFGLGGSADGVSAYGGSGDDGSAVAVVSSRVIVTGTGGAGGWKEEWSDLLRGRDVLICYDWDKAGNEGAARVAKALVGIAAQVRRVPSPNVEGVKDLSDLLLHSVRKDRASGLPDDVAVERAAAWFERLAAEAPVVEVPPASAPGAGSVVTLTEVGEYFGAVEWAWDQWIPRAHLTMIAGVSGVGKSYLAASVMAAFTGARSLPDGSRVDPAGPVCLVETEEFRGPYCQRLLAHGVRPGDVLLPVVASDPTYLLDLSREMELVAGVVEQHGCRLVVVDSLSAGHALDENSAEMRGLLRELARSAGTLGVSMLLVHHVRKRATFETEQVTLDRIRGSSTIIQFCRSIWGVWKPDPEVPDVRVECLKNSFAAPPEAFGFRVDGESGVVVCGPAPELARVETTVGRAAEYLMSALRAEPLKYSDLLPGAEQIGISKNSLYRARSRMGIVVAKDGRWSLPAQGRE